MQNDILKRLIILLVILLVGGGISVAGGDGGARYVTIPVFIICGAWAFLINWIAFVPANAAQTEKFYDVVGSLTYLSVIGLALLLTPQLSDRALIAAAMVIIWALRLGTFLFIRINQDGHDNRFDEIKVNPSRFFIAWSIQALWVLVTAACALAIITGGNQAPVNMVGMLGIVIWVVGFIIEVVADWQKRTFRRNPYNKGKFINSGIWSWSRHPNYFGEITLWFGMAVMAIPILSGGQWVTLISPIFVVFLLTKVSGIPTLAKKSKERWGDDADYQAYLANTSLLIPLPPKK
ncbi:MAG: steroid 5-alpha reductase family enzyme [Arenicella sp.]|jgi:steroid 5-alpha reductase family enzyme